MHLKITALYLSHNVYVLRPSGRRPKEEKIHRAFHNVLRDYKHLKQENQKNYLNGIVHSHRKTGKKFF
jgi:hypothetical protein